VNRMEKKMEEGSEVGGLRLLKALRARGGEGKGGGGVGSVPRGGKRRSGEGPDAAINSVEWPAMAPGHRARAAALWRDRGGRRGAVDSARVAD
jgi:hypothetical protein